MRIGIKPRRRKKNQIFISYFHDNYVYCCFVEGFLVTDDNICIDSRTNSHRSLQSNRRNRKRERQKKTVRSRQGQKQREREKDTVFLRKLIF